MPVRRYTQRRRFSFRRDPRPILNSITNRVTSAGGLSGTTSAINFAKAVTSPSPTVTTDVSHGCIIQAIWLNIDVCGLAGSGVLNIADFYLFKNPGANLTAPAPLSVGSSNEKRFVVKQWRAMIMANADGNNPFHWEGWLLVPKKFQRMGTDDIWALVHACSSGVTGHISIEYSY